MESSARDDGQLVLASPASAARQQALTRRRRAAAHLSLGSYSTNSLKSFRLQITQILTLQA
jgi:hypothetical protein